MLYDVNTHDNSLDGADGEEALSSKELQQFFVLATQQAKFQAEAHIYNEICWDMCVDKPGTKLDNKTSACLGNCVNRFLDVVVYITNRYNNILQREASKM